MDTQLPKQKKPRVSKRKKYILTLVLIIFGFFIALQLYSIVAIFFDIYSLFPLRTYTGKAFSLSYPQNWQAHGDSDGVSMRPQMNFLNDVLEREEYNWSDMFLVTQPAGSASIPGADAEEQMAREQRFPAYKVVNMPRIVTIGGSTWVQLVATYNLDFKDGSTAQIEEIVLSTVQRTKDGSFLSFFIDFSTDPIIFDQTYSQVFQRILHSFAFR